ncbi:hypothetical protein RN001_009893 [Aquatica leii]|uniref:Uncharacterized protein n=1 Tax=Aquatica leii TaxID=1421715 RepID=A0AAN7PVU2_9COLE|nr:hypothetical protein RN001_009893 [Aquatica leii]
MNILKNAKTLKGTDIWINEDYLKEVQEERRRLIPYMTEAKNKGYKALIRYDKLIINNETYRTKDLEKDEEHENGEASNKSRQKKLCRIGRNGRKLQKKQRNTSSYKKNNNKKKTSKQTRKRSRVANCYVKHISQKSSNERLQFQNGMYNLIYIYLFLLVF